MFRNTLLSGTRGSTAVERSPTKIKVTGSNPDMYGHPDRWPGAFRCDFAGQSRYQSRDLYLCVTVLLPLEGHIGLFGTLQAEVVLMVNHLTLKGSEFEAR